MILFDDMQEQLYSMQYLRPHNRGRQWSLYIPKPTGRWQDPRPHRRFSRQQVFGDSFASSRTWGPEYKRAWEFQCSLDRSRQAEVTDFDGHPIQFTVTKQMVHEALHTKGLFLPERNLTHSEKAIVTDQAHLTFTNFKQKEIPLALQLYMQIFGLAHTQKYTMPEIHDGVAPD